MTFIFPKSNAAAALLALVTAVACSGDDASPPTGTWQPPPDGGTLPPPPDKTAPTLTDRFPAPDADNIWLGSPIRLTFSEPLAPASVNAAAITLQTEAGPVAVHSTLSADGREIRVALDSPHVGPARLTISVGSAITDVVGNAFAGASWSWRAPLWEVPAKKPVEGLTGPLQPSLALDADGNPIVAYCNGAGRAQVRVSKLEGGQWADLGEGALNVQPDDVASMPRLAFSADIGGPIVVWQEAGREKHIFAKALLGGKWELLGQGPLDAGIGREPAEPNVGINASGNLMVAWIADGSRVEIRSWQRGTWQPVVPAWAAGQPIADLAFEPESLAIAAVVGKGADAHLHVVRWSDGRSSWLELGDILDRAVESVPTKPRLALSRGGTLGIVWQENDGHSDNVYAARYDEPTGDFRVYGHALDLDIDSPAYAPSIGFEADGTPWVAWNETHPEGPRSYVARYAEDHWDVPGANNVTPEARAAVATDVVVDGASSSPVVLLEERIAGDAGAPSRIWLRRYNGGSEMPHAAIERRAPPCSFPAASAPEFPRTLTATKCFADVPRRIPAPGLIPYDLNSPLWSDGALKRRFLILPEGGHLVRSDRFTWEVPTGTIFVKEFLYEREPGNPATTYPMETRFLVKRCEPGLCRAAWEGYSYQWNEAGTEAVLLDHEGATVYKDWPAGASAHRHGYPGRTECTQCHAISAGGVLGLQTAQFNRNFDYGEVVDNQMRALLHAGLFDPPRGDGGAGDGGSEDGASEAGSGGDGGALPEGGTTEGGASPEGGLPDGGSVTPKMPYLPNPYDPSWTNNERIRSYFHTNCSHCHSPEGRWPVINFRYDAPLVGEKEPDANICNELVPGDAAKSRVYIKDSAREGNIPPDMFGTPMPPLGTLKADERQIAVLRNWIHGMKSCP